MRYTGTLTLILILFMSLSVNASAQRGDRERGQQEQGQRQGQRQGRGGEGNSERMLKFMKDSLQITAEQEVQIKKINDDSKKRIDALRKEASQMEDRSAMREQFKALMTESDEKILAVLTPEQQVKYKAMKAQRAKKMKENGNRGRSRDKNDSSERSRSRERSR